MWYNGYLDRGRSRHIESMVFWSGDGYSRTEHLVLGDALGPPGEEDYAHGWHSPYTLGGGGNAIYQHVE